MISSTEWLNMSLKRTKPRSATLVEQIIVGLRSVFSHALTTV